MFVENQIPGLSGIEIIDPGALEYLENGGQFTPTSPWENATKFELTAYRVAYEGVMTKLALFKERENTEVERQRANEEHRNATIDPVTNLYNRRGFIEATRAAIKTAQPTDRFVVMFADLNSFKDFNDNNSHDVGDQVLYIVGDTLRTLLPDSVLARLGGDEFAILHKIDCTNVLDINEYCERQIASAIENIQKNSLKLILQIPDINMGDFGISVGQSNIHSAESATVWRTMLMEADEVMYARKPTRTSHVRQREA